MAKTRADRRPRSKIPPQNVYGGNNNLVPCTKKKYQKTRVKRVSWRDELLQTMNVGDIDPAILVVRDDLVIRYSRDRLLELRSVPASKSKPQVVIGEIPASILDPEKWNLERKKSDTSTENGPRAGDISEHRQRRPNDPRERIRKENDGIVLSPQRRSFNTGCFVPNRECSTGSGSGNGSGGGGRSGRSHSPLGKGEATIVIREVQAAVAANRRIGSGRIIRDWGDDKGGSGDGPSGDSEYFGPRGGRGGGDDRRGGTNNEDKYERRSYGRDYESKENKEGGGRRNGRYSERRRMASDGSRADEEPEWFSGGPISQHDTIELVGAEELLKNKKEPPKSRNSKYWKKRSEEKQSIAEEKENEEKPDQKEKNGNQKRSSTPSTNAQNEASDKKKEEKKAPEKEKQNEEDNQHGFSFDDILKCDSIQGLLTNGVTADGEATKSRFSRWFQKESPEKMLESRRSSIQEENHLIKDILKDIAAETNIAIPGDSEAYFAPISPAGNTGGRQNMGPVAGQPINLMEMLQRSKQMGEAMKQPPPPMTGKILSLDELEAKIRHNSDHNFQQKSTQQKPDEEMAAAFKRMLAQAGGHQIPQNGPMPKSQQPMSLLEMLNHSQQQDEARIAAAAAAANSTSHHLYQHQAGAGNDLTLKLQQAAAAAAAAQQQQKQMELLNKLINATASRVSPQFGASNAAVAAAADLALQQQQSRELLNRPEAQAILHAMHQRIPSPRELQVHTQNILQRALIKKKLEEQTENYRKKQEMVQAQHQRGGASPSAGAGAGKGGVASSPTPLAFTPTSVLRKMTADKDEGRPIVKANTYQPSQTAEQFFNQQRLYNLQQQQQQQQHQQSQPIRKSVQSQFPQQNSQMPQYPGNQYPNQQQFSQQQQLQQLRAQHQHRSVNQQQPSGQQPQGQQGQQQGNAMWQQLLSNAQNNTRTSNSANQQPPDSGPAASQLSRWFSPALLERARGGELPSTANLAEHALSLEEIERQTAPPVHN